MAFEAKHWQVLAMAPAALVLTMPSPAYAVVYLSTSEAQKLLFPGAQVFEPAHLLFKPDQVQKLEAVLHKPLESRGLQIWKVRDPSGKFLGLFILDYVIGKHELIDYAVALNPLGQIEQVEILAYRESYGSEIRRASWRKQFIGKDSKSPINLHEDIVNIGGATLSCRHVTEGVKKIMEVYELFLK